MRALVPPSDLEREICLAGNFRIHLRGVFSATLGEEWDTQGQVTREEFHHIELPLCGQRAIVHGGEIFPLQPGEVWFLPGNTLYERRWQSVCEVLLIKVSCEWLPGVDPLFDWRERGPRKMASFNLTEWSEWLKPEKNVGMVEVLHLRGSVLAWIAKAVPELAEVVRSHLASHMQFSKVLAMVESELGANIRVAALAKLHGASVDAFSSAFTRSMGMSPKDYILRRLNSEAQRLMMNTDLKIKEIADRLRFNDEFHFSRFFKRMNGAPPSDWRRRMRYVG